jgi:hypothetical protein
MYNQIVDSMLTWGSWVAQVNREWNPDVVKIPGDYHGLHAVRASRAPASGTADRYLPRRRVSDGENGHRPQSVCVVNISNRRASLTSVRSRNQFGLRPS